MKAIIIDDNIKAIETLSERLKSFDNVELAGKATTGKKGLLLLRSIEPDVVFLDIELPDMTGIEFLEQMKNTTRGWCRIVMYTAYEKYMLESFRNEAFDYLMKPIDGADLKRVVERLCTSRSSAPYSAAEPEAPKRSEADKMLFYTGSADFRLVHLRDIGLFQYNHDMRVWEAVIASKKEPVRLKRHVNNESLLTIDPRFVQVSQRFIINISYLFEVNDNVCRLYPPFDKINYIKVGRLFRKKLIDRFCSL